MFPYMVIESLSYRKSKLYRIVFRWRKTRMRPGSVSCFCLPRKDALRNKSGAMPLSSLDDKFSRWQDSAAAGAQWEITPAPTMPGL